MATIYDVATAAGVSPKTVSRVLNRDPLVARATRSNVERHMSRLGYVPSNAARSMRSARSGLIGVISGGISEVEASPEYSGLPEVFILQGVQDEIARAGKTVLIADTGGLAENVPGLFRTFAEHRVEALIYVAAHHQQVDLPPAPGIRDIVIANGFDAAGTPSVVPDDHAGERAVVERLIGAGHRRIAYLTLRGDMIATQERTRGYRDALSAAGLPFDAALVREGQGYRADLDEDRAILGAALEQLLQLPDPPTVICCGNDPLALQLYGRLRRRGIRVPEEMSVVGYDDYRLITETLHPALTTVELPYRRIGQEAARLLLGRLASGEEDGPTEASVPLRVAGEVRWRGSVLPAGSVRGPSSQDKPRERTT